MREKTPMGQELDQNDFFSLFHIGHSDDFLSHIHYKIIIEGILFEKNHSSLLFLVGPRLYFSASQNI